MLPYRVSSAALDAEDGDMSKGCKRAEGIVVRSSDRRYIKKLRFEDYEKTFRERNSLKSNLTGV